MKTRSGYVSNSSSCSFIINKRNLTDEQKELVLSLAEPDWYRDQDGVIDVVCHDKNDSYELEVDSCRSGQDGYLAVSIELDHAKIRYGVDWC